MVFSEDCDSYTRGSMTADGLNAGTLDGWTTGDGEKGNRYTPDQLTRRGINRLMHTAPEGPKGEVQFALLIPTPIRIRTST
jgi:hypothetical protein